MNRIFCEVCNGNDLIKQDGVFVCQYCGTKYSLEEIKKQLVEIAGPVQVVGVDNADTLYNRVLDWLNLQNNAKAIEVLKDMTEKYPGDIRGWSKLARLDPQKPYIDNAVHLGDKALYDEWEAKAEAACAEVRNGQAEKWVRAYGNHKDFILNSDERYNSFPCVKALLVEGKENAEYFNNFCRTLKAIGYKSSYGEAFRSMWGEYISINPKNPPACLIIGNLFNTDLCNSIITKAKISRVRFNRRMGNSLSKPFSR